MTDIKHIFTKIIIIIKNKRALSRTTQSPSSWLSRVLWFYTMRSAATGILSVWHVSSSSESSPVQFSSSSSKSNNSILSSSSLSKTGIFWLVNFPLVGFGGLGALRGVLRGMGLGSSSLSSTLFFCRFVFVAGVRRFWTGFPLPTE